MKGTEIGPGPDNAIDASWERCQRQHRLTRNVAHPILRLQSSEVAPRLEELVERTGGRQGVFRQLAEIVAEAGHCLVVTDADGILVRLESKDAGRSGSEWNGIALGSCWDERIAGTNGVAMAMLERKAFTVRGKDHFFSKLRPFACTAVPLFDAENQMVGAVNLAIIDRGNPGDYLFAKQLLSAAADRIQRILFERRFGDTTIVSVSLPGQGDLLRSNELVAVNEAGIVLGSTAKAHRLVGMKDSSELTGRPFDVVFGADAETINRVPERVLSVRAQHRPLLNLSTRAPGHGTCPGRGWRREPARTPWKPLRRRLAPSFRELAVGSNQVAALCARANAHFRRALPFVIEGESGTGKSTLAAALHDTAKLALEQIVTVDCASLGENADDRIYVQTIFEQARVVGSLAGTNKGLSTLVFDNVDEMPAYAQAGLRSLLSDFETGGDPIDPDSPVLGPRILGTSRNPLWDAVRNGRFRDDLYFLLADTLIELPPLRLRKRLDALAHAIALRLAGTEVEIAREAIEAFAAYHWPGNVRELRSVLQQALMEGNGRRISPIDLRHTSVLTRSTCGRTVTDENAQSPPHILYDERSMLLDALVGARWNVSQAARSLGMGRATIHRKMKRHAISRPT